MERKAKKAVKKVHCGVQAGFALVLLEVSRREAEGERTMTSGNCHHDAISS